MEDTIKKMPMNNASYTFNAMTDMSASGFDLGAISVLTVFALILGAAFSLTFYKRIQKLLSFLGNTIVYFLTGIFTLSGISMLYYGGSTIGRGVSAIPLEYYIYTILIYVGASALGYAVSGIYHQLNRTIDGVETKK